MDKSPFDEISIYRGKKVKGNHLINAAFKDTSKSLFRKVGKFKGKITIISEIFKNKIEKMKIPNLLMPGLHII